MSNIFPTYRGRIAPSPTGYLHLGHAKTFSIAQQRAESANGVLVLRSEDLDTSRARPEFCAAMIEDLRWFGLRWQEGPDVGGRYAPYAQSDRMELYRGIFEELKQRGVIYPCTCSRQDVLRAAQAPHQGEEEPVYPGTCRNRSPQDHLPATKINWRFRISEGEKVRFSDGNFGAQQFIAGHDFGDFVAWRHDDIPSYQLACVVDDHMMKITEVVRGADLLMSTARQLLIYRSLDWEPPAFYHCELLRDEHGERLAKRHDSLSLRALRAQGASPGQLSIYGGGQSG